MLAKDQERKNLLNPFTGQLHDYPVWQQQHICYYECRKRCGKQILFDEKLSQIMV
jgi:hypothetical protein